MLVIDCRKSLKYLRMPLGSDQEGFTHQLTEEVGKLSQVELVFVYTKSLVQGILELILLESCCKVQRFELCSHTLYRNYELN